MNKKPVPVLVAYTKPLMWRAIQEIKIAVQAENSPNAEYIAFILTGTEKNKGRGIITHMAEVEKIEYSVPAEKYLKMAPYLRGLYREKEWVNPCKFYYLAEFKELDRSILHKLGDAARGQVKFFTTLEELKSARFLSDIRTLSQLSKK